MLDIIKIWSRLFWILLLSSAMSAYAAETIPLHTIQHLFDIKGDRSRPLILPTDVAIHDDLIYVVDSGNHRIQVFDDDGDAEYHFGGEGIGEGKFLGPIGIDVDSGGRVYVADAGNNRMQIFDKKGKYLTGFDVIHNNISIRPVDVVVHEQERLIYVSGNNNHHVMGFSIKGKVKYAWGGDGVEVGEFRYPATMAILPDQRLAVVDVLNTRVQLFAADGGTPIEVGRWGALPGHLVRPKGVAVDQAGRIFISDSYMGVVQVFNDVGNFISVLANREGHKERKKGQPIKFRTPAGIAIDKKNRLYITEMRANKVSVWQIAPFPEKAQQ